MAPASPPSSCFSVCMSPMPEPLLDGAFGLGLSRLARLPSKLLHRLCLAWMCLLGLLKGAAKLHLRRCGLEAGADFGKHSDGRFGMRRGPRGPRRASGAVAAVSCKKLRVHVVTCPRCFMETV